MPFEQLETVYESLALAVDSAGPAREALFLSKLVLLLAQRLGEAALVQQDIATALRDLPD
jgi:hypothetical protein